VLLSLLRHWSLSPGSDHEQRLPKLGGSRVEVLQAAEAIG
jgi:hypothetical protein